MTLYIYLWTFPAVFVRIKRASGFTGSTGSAVTASRPMTCSCIAEIWQIYTEIRVTNKLHWTFNKSLWISNYCRSRTHIDEIFLYIKTWSSQIPVFKIMHQVTFTNFKLLRDIQLVKPQPWRTSSVMIFWLQIRKMTWLLLIFTPWVSLHVNSTISSRNPRLQLPDKCQQSPTNKTVSNTTTIRSTHTPCCLRSLFTRETVVCFLLLADDTK